MPLQQDIRAFERWALKDSAGRAYLDGREASRGEFRPLLISEESGEFLWIGVTGRPLLASGLRQVILKRTEEQLGKRISPHLFRDCLATMIALERPERIDDVSALLGHRRPDWKTGYIAVARSIVAQRLRQDLEDEARRKYGRKLLSFRSAGRQR